MNTFFSKSLLFWSITWFLGISHGHAFISPNPSTSSLRHNRESQQQNFLNSRSTISNTALHIWWFGGTENSENVISDDESCELVAVRIERTSANSRRIAGDITVPAPLKDVWAILTDYDRLAIHVPNLVESKIQNVKTPNAQRGDGNYKCRLYQKGAQKIVGFDFSASVTMDMTERILNSSSGQKKFLLPPASSSSSSSSSSSVDNKEENFVLSNDRMIGFKCTDSFFFSEFDGEWKVREQVNEAGEIETNVSYIVDVRPKGPVPVAALEWRIREDVPSNLRAVKKAALVEGESGVLAARQRASATRGSVPVRKISRSQVNEVMKRNAAVGRKQTLRSLSASRANKSIAPVPSSSRLNKKRRPVPVRMPEPAVAQVQWDRDETMAKYQRSLI